MNDYPSAIYPIAYQVSHPPESRYLIEKPVYKIHIRSSRNNNLTKDDWNKELEFKIHFDESMPQQNDIDYQVAVESFHIYVDINNSHHNRPFALHAIGNRAKNTSDVYTSYAGTATATGAGRSDVLAFVHTNGIHQYITPDMIGVPCENLNIFANKTIRLQLRHMYGDEPAEGDVGNRSSYTYGDWCATLVLYPKKK